MSEEKSEDILKSILTNVLDSKDEIELKDVRKIKKRGRPRKEEVINREKNPSISDSLEIINKEASFVRWEDIKVKEKRSIQENITLWNSVDFYYYCKDICEKKYKFKWNLKMMNAKMQIGILRDSLQDVFGFQSNLMIRDYIDYFFMYCMDYYDRIGKEFYFSMLRQEKFISSFQSTYDYRKSFSNYMIEKKKKNMSLEAQALRQSYEISLSNMLIFYGIIITTNWLICNKKMEPKEALQKVFKECQTIYKNSQIGIVKKATEEYSPYPQRFVFKNPNAILSRIDRSNLLSVEFIDNEETELNFKCIKKGSIK